MSAYRVSSRGNHLGGGGGGGGGGAPGNGHGFIYFSIQLSQILGGGGGKLPPHTPPWMKPCAYVPLHVHALLLETFTVFYLSLSVAVCLSILIAPHYNC